jgi:hypothetical protein
MFYCLFSVHNRFARHIAQQAAQVVLKMIVQANATLDGGVDGYWRTMRC